jgi:hypothetical protein
MRDQDDADPAAPNGEPERAGGERRTEEHEESQVGAASTSGAGDRKCHGVFIFLESPFDGAVRGASARGMP